MKILFLRHGESVDDLTNQFGGWADFPLTYNGKVQIADRLDKLEDLNTNFETVLSSPLARAHESGEIISNYFGIPHQTYHYLKEHNGYGLLSGLNKDEAKELYPELSNLLGTDKYIMGAEPLDKFQERVITCLNKILEMDFSAVIAVTHGGFMKQIFEKIFRKDYKTAHDGGFVLAEFKSKNNFKLLAVDGIEYE